MEKLWLRQTFSTCCLPIIKISFLVAVGKLAWNLWKLWQQKKVPKDEKAYNNDQCPICMTPPCWEIRTNCGHIFCGLCFKEFFETTKSGPNRYLCPLCRSKVSVLHKYYKITSDEGLQIDKTITTFMKEYQTNYRLHMCTTALRLKLIVLVLKIILFCIFMLLTCFPYLKNGFYYFL